ncbi:MAG: porin [Pirellulaceae bacterium]|nr:porin [Planctomycetaceae bacterium]MDG1806455.1 porin [Pirellulaceae bacterium]MDG2102978.1 porin [Pirellulaceae bacterium]
MHARILSGVCTVLAICLASQTVAQEGGYVPVTTPQTTFASSAQTRLQEDEEKNLLAKQLDEFNRRLQALETGAEVTAEEQQPGTYIDRIGSLEKSILETQEAIESIDEDMGMFAKMGHGNETMKVFGRIHTDWWTFPNVDSQLDLLEGDRPPQARLIFRRMRIGVTGRVRDNMIYKIAMEFAGGADSQYRDAYLGFEDLPLFQTLLIGNQKRPYGLDTLNSSRYNVFMERPFVVEALNQDARRLGIASYGLSRDLRYNWRLGVYNQELVQAKSGYIGNNLQGELAGRMATTWWYDECSGGRGYGHLAVSGSWGSPAGNSDGILVNANQARYRTRPEARTTGRWINTGRIDDADNFYLGGLETVFNAGPVNITGEYMGTSVGRAGADSVNFHGGYAQAAYFLTGEHMPWDRKTGTLGRIKPFENFFSVCDCDGFLQRGIGAWQVAARCSYADFTDKGINGGVGRSLTLGLNWYWNPYARMQLNYIFGNISDRGVPAVGGPEVKGDYQIAGLRFMIDF